MAGQSVSATVLSIGDGDTIRVRLPIGRAVSLAIQTTDPYGR